jgi:hypothetical protein
MSGISSPAPPPVFSAPPPDEGPVFNGGNTDFDYSSGPNSDAPGAIDYSHIPPDSSVTGAAYSPTPLTPPSAISPAPTISNTRMNTQPDQFIGVDAEEGPETDTATAYRSELDPILVGPADTDAFTGHAARDPFVNPQFVSNSDEAPPEGFYVTPETASGITYVNPEILVEGQVPSAAANPGAGMVLAGMGFSAPYITDIPTSGRPTSQLDLAAVSMLAAPIVVAAGAAAAGAGLAGAVGSFISSVNSYVAALYGQLSSVGMAAVSGTQLAAKLGREGEAWIADSPGYQTIIPSLTGTASMRIMDALEYVAELAEDEGMAAGAWAIEVKNAAYVALTEQLEDFIMFASLHDIPLYLVTRVDTELSGPLMELEQQGYLIWVKFFPSQGGLLIRVHIKRGKNAGCRTTAGHLERLPRGSWRVKVYTGTTCRPRGRSAPW